MRRVGGLNADIRRGSGSRFSPALRGADGPDRPYPEDPVPLRVHAASTADNPLSKKYAYDSGKRAVLDHIRRCGEEAEVTDTKFPGFYRVRYRVSGEPFISILIPNKDERETLKKCLNQYGKVDVPQL